MFSLKSLRTKSRTTRHSNDFFHMAIVGRTGSGKTRYLLSLLRGEFFKKFNAIFLICPTFEKNQAYDSFYTDDKFYVLPGLVENIENSISMARDEATKYYRSLIIFDDIIGTPTLNSRTTN